MANFFIFKSTNYNLIYEMEKLTMENSTKRTVIVENKKGLTVSDVILVAVLLAAGAVLKFFVGNLVNIGGMKPNFVIAMYCLAVLLIKPKIHEAAVIGILAGVICQLFPGTPYINIGSELAGSVTMALMIKAPMTVGKFSLSPIISTFISTVVSGSLFTLMLFFFASASLNTMIAYVPIVLCTALFNCVIVQALYLPIKKILKK